VCSTALERDSRNCWREKAKPAQGFSFALSDEQRAALFLWPELASDVLTAGRPLTELHGVGPFISKQLQAWIEKPPREETKPPAIRRDFLTRAGAPG